MKKKGKKNIRAAFKMNPYELFDERDEFDKHIDMIEFQCDDTDDDILNKSAEIIDDQLKMSALLNDGEDDVLNVAYDKVSKPFPRNMVHIVQNSKKEINHNMLVAKIRLINGQKGAHFKEEMEDVFYPIETWPNFAIEILLSENFRYQVALGIHDYQSKIINKDFHFGSFSGVWEDQPALETFELIHSNFTEIRAAIKQLNDIKPFHYFNVSNYPVKIIVITTLSIICIILLCVYIYCTCFKQNKIDHSFILRDIEVRKRNSI